jgi:hypothetical protein
MPIRANTMGPPLSATRISASIAIRQRGDVLPGIAQRDQLATVHLNRIIERPPQP